MRRYVTPSPPKPVDWVKVRAHHEKIVAFGQRRAREIMEMPHMKAMMGGD